MGENILILLCTMQDVVIAYAFILFKAYQLVFTKDRREEQMSEELDRWGGLGWEGEKQQKCTEASLLGA